MPAHSKNAVPLAALAVEVRLLIASLCWPMSPEDKHRIVQLAAAAPQWNELYALAAQHRVLPLVYRNLALSGVEIPETVRAAWKAAATRNAFAAMRSLAETARLQALLSTAGISPLVLKGVPLSVAAYGDPSLRDVGDIDLLLSPGEEGRADVLLQADGFVRKDPAARLTPRRRLSYRRHAKDYTYAPGEAGFELDLHWRLFRNPHMPGNGLVCAEGIQEVRLGGECYRTLPAAHSVLHLCVHGALDGWLRLKSLADVAALWRLFTAEDRESLLRLARRHAVVSELAAALLLACELQLLDRAELPPSILLLESDATVVHILRNALTQWRRSRFLPASAARGSWAIKHYEIGLRSGAAYRLEILRRILFRPRVWERFDLPDALFPLYALLSPVEWLLFRFGQRGRQSDPVPLPRASKQWFWPGRLRQWWTRLRQVRLSDRLLLVEAACALVAARLALRILPPRTILRWMRQNGVTHALGNAASRGAGPDGSEHAVNVDRVRWAVLTATRYAPFRFVCFPQALAAHSMLRRRKVASEVVYGIRRSAEGKLRAHTWLRVGERTVLGGETAPLFFPIDLSP